MIVYRCITEKELAHLIGLNVEIDKIYGNNTFTYKNNTDYRHFYYFYDSAISFMKIRNNERFYNKYITVLAFNINDELLKKYFGLGKYKLYCVNKELKDELLENISIIYYPEFCIPNKLIKKNMIVGIGDSNRLTPINYDNLSDIVNKNQKEYLRYLIWLFNNGYNVSKNNILENKDNLFKIKTLK